MKIEEIKVSELKPYENNPRIIPEEAVERVAASIREFGFKVPLVIDKDNVIVTGHTRLKAAQRLGLATVPCVRAAELTPEQVRAFRLADNKTGEFSRWDDSKLLEELGGIQDIDMEDFGFVGDPMDGDDDGAGAPGEFTEYGEDDEAKHRCPRCGYEWR